MSGLVEFLDARIEWDETLARNAMGVPDWWPTRLLTECEAKRRIVALHGGDYDGECQSPAHLDGPCRTLRTLALPYADHPDYREEWR